LKAILIVPKWKGNNMGIPSIWQIVNEYFEYEMNNIGGMLFQPFIGGKTFVFRNENF
jgi:hypothetical protein